MMMQRGKREETRGRLVWKEGGGGESDRRGAVVCVWCVKISVQVWGEVCVRRGRVCVCVSAVELGFTLLTSHTFPPVTKGKYIHTQKCTVIEDTPGYPGCTLYVLYVTHTHMHSVCALSESHCEFANFMHVRISLCRKRLYPLAARAFIPVSLIWQVVLQTALS